MTLPQPRPALRKAADGSVHPASTHLSSLSVSLADVEPALAGDTGKKKSKKKKARKSDGDVVDVVVPLPRSIRKTLRKRAEAHGWTAEEAAAHVLRAWAEG